MLGDPVWQRVGVVLLHFVWQAMLVNAVYALVAWLLRRRPLSERYLLAVAALTVMAACPIVSWFFVDTPGDFIHPSSWIVAWVVACWLAGLAVFAARFAASLNGIQRLGRCGLPHGWDCRLADLSRRLGLSAPPRLIATQQFDEALVVGFLRPTIVIPAGWLDELPSSTIEAVLAHELAHVCRFDLWINAVQRCVESLLFFHPSVWWLSQKIRAKREMCCDEVAVAVTERRLAYVSALESIARRRAAGPQIELATGIGGLSMALVNRVHYLLGVKSISRRTLLWPVISLIAALGLGLWMTSGDSPPALSRAKATAQADEPTAASLNGAVSSSSVKPATFADDVPPHLRRGDSFPPRDYEGRLPPPPRVIDDLRHAIWDLQKEVHELRREIIDLKSQQATSGSRLPQQASIMRVQPRLSYEEAADLLEAMQQE